MAHRHRKIQLHFMVTEHERGLIAEKMERLGTKNLGAYLRKMAVDGYMIQLDLADVRELVSLTSANKQQFKSTHQTGTRNRQCLWE